MTSAAAVLVLGLVGLAGFATVLAGKNRELDAKNRAGTNQELDRQRQRAEAREALAIDAVKKFRDAVQANAELKNRPELDALRKALLKEPLEFFRKLRDQLQSDRDTRPEALAKLAGADLDLATPRRRSAASPTRSARTPSRSTSWSGSSATTPHRHRSTRATWPRASTASATC